MSQTTDQLVPSAASDFAVVPHPVRRLRAEANFLKFPFFDLAREASGATRETLEVREIVSGPHGSKTEILWKVFRAAETPFPGELARRIHREVVEYRLSTQPHPIQNPVCLGSLREICRLLKINTSGRNLSKIQTAFVSIQRTSVQAKSTLYLKSKKCYFDDNFHVYDRVIFTGKPLPDGRVADAVYVVLSDWYLENLNANYVVPLDFDYFRQIKGSIASRMYELLHHWCFVTFRVNQPTIERRYSTLCAYFPIARQDTLWKAKQQLRNAHHQHYQNGYLAGLPEWRPVHGTKKDWTIVYTPGKRARDEYRRNHTRRDQDGLAPDELPPGAQRLLPLASPSGLSELQQDLVRELEVHGVTDSIALALVKDHAPDFIHQKIEAFQWLMAKSDRPITTNPAGYLRTSIEQNYAPPEGFVSKAERERKSAEEAARQRAEKDARARADRERQDQATAIEARWTALSPADRSAIEARAESSLAPFARQALARERLDGRQSGTGHFALRAEIEKLLAAALES